MSHQFGANEPPTDFSEPQSGANKLPDEAVKRPNAPDVSADGGDLYDADSQHPSWEPKADFTAFLEKHFRRKLFYDQVSDILDGYSNPSVDCLFSPTLDSSVLSQISPLSLESIHKSVTRNWPLCRGPCLT